MKMNGNNPVCYCRFDSCMAYEKGKLPDPFKKENFDECPVYAHKKFDNITVDLHWMFSGNIVHN